MATAKRRNRYSSSDKNRILIIVIAIMIALYFGLFFPKSRSDLAWEQNMVNRKLNRIDARSEEIEQPKVSTNVLERQLTDLDLRLKVGRQRLATHKNRFADVEAPDELKALRLELSELAQRNGIDVQKMSELTFPNTPQTANKTPSETEGEELRSAERPRLTLVGRGSFGGVLRFVDGLTALSRHAVVMRMQLAVVPAAGKAGKEDVAYPLSINLQIAL